MSPCPRGLKKAPVNDNTSGTHCLNVAPFCRCSRKSAWASNVTAVRDKSEAPVSQMGIKKACQKREVWELLGCLPLKCISQLQQCPSPPCIRGAFFLIVRPEGIGLPQSVWQSRVFHITAVSLLFSDQFIGKDDKFVINYVWGGKTETVNPWKEYPLGQYGEMTYLRLRLAWFSFE